MDQTAEFEALGLSATETRVYLSVLASGSIRAQEIADQVGMARSTIYSILRSLQDRELIQAGAGHGTRFSAVPPERALPTLIAREREALEERELATRALTEKLRLVAEGAGPVTPDIVEVIRNRRANAARFDSLQRHATKEVDVLVKPPFLSGRKANPVEDEMLDRGVRYRAIYERGVAEDPGFWPLIRRWVASGEEARVYDGTLPLKMALFDSHSALLPLEVPNSSKGFTGVVIHHDALGAGLRVLFDFLWGQSQSVESISEDSLAVGYEQ